MNNAEFTQSSAATAQYAKRLMAKHGRYFRRFMPDLVLRLRFQRKPYVSRNRLLENLYANLRETEKSAGHPIAWAIVESRGPYRRYATFYILISGFDNKELHKKWSFTVPPKVTKKQIQWSSLRGVARFFVSSVLRK